MEIELIDTIDNTSNSTIIISNKDRVSDIKEIIYNKLRNKIDIDRITIFYYYNSNKIYLSSNSSTLESYPGFTPRTVLYVTDSGFLISKQISSLIENIGPILLQSLIYFSNGSFTPCLIQQLAYFMSIIHFLIQILGNIYMTSFTTVHKANSKVSLTQMVMKCVLNWIIFGLICGITLYTNDYQYNQSNRTIVKYAFVLLFFVCEYFALFYKIILYQSNRDREGGLNQDNIVGLYKVMIYPHYFMEFCAWVSYAIVVNTLSIFIFTCGMMILLCTESVNEKKRYLNKRRKHNNINVNINKDDREEDNEMNKYAFIPYLF